jgi:citrate synthase
MSAEADYKPGLEDVPAAKSAVSFLDGKKAVLEYRGIAVEVLAKESSFEETSWLLIKGTSPRRRSWPSSTTTCGSGGPSTSG